MLSQRLFRPCSTVWLFNFDRIDIKPNHLKACLAEFGHQKRSDAAEADNSDPGSPWIRHIDVLEVYIRSLKIEIYF